MDAEAQRRFARVMIDTWPNGPRAYIWEGVASTCDVDLARRAYRDLRDSSDRAPTPAQFHAVYLRLQRAEIRDALPRHCELCDGQGWVDASTVTLDGVHHSASKPCRCTIGEQREPTHRAILEANRR